MVAILLIDSRPTPMVLMIVGLVAIAVGFLLFVYAERVARFWVSIRNGMPWLFPISHSFFTLYTRAIGTFLVIGAIACETYAIWLWCYSSVHHHY
jgi:hypothetical protein